MQQYFSGRENKKTSDIIAKDSSNVNIENAVFANERVDASWDKARVKIHNSTFAKMGFLNSKFKQCDLSFCVFINCYFKKAYFEQTKFIGCIFINCNFVHTAVASGSKCAANGSSAVSAATEIIS